MTMKPEVITELANASCLALDVVLDALNSAKRPSAKTKRLAALALRLDAALVNVDHNEHGKDFTRVEALR